MCCGATTETGCGSNVSTLSEPAITSRWPRCTPSKVPTATLRSAARSTSGRRVTFTAPKPRCSPVLGPPRPARARGRGRRARRGGLQPLSSAASSSSPAGQLVPRSGGAMASATSNGPIAVRRSSQAVRVAEVGDQRAHVGARAALDLIAGALQAPGARRAAAPALLEAVTVTIRSGISQLLPAPRALVRALASDLHRRVRRRALADLARRQRRRVGGDPAGDVISPSGSPVLELAPSARPSRSAWAAPSAPLGFRGAADEHEQQAGRERVERAGVPERGPRAAAERAAYGRRRRRAR